MSKPNPTTELLRDLAEKTKGRKIYGGCEECEAYQTIDPDPIYLNMVHVRIHHDDWCPFYARIQRS